MLPQISLKVSLTGNSTETPDNKQCDEHEDTAVRQRRSGGLGLRVDQQRPSAKPLDDEERSDDTQHFDTIDNDLR